MDIGISRSHGLYPAVLHATTGACRVEVPIAAAQLRPVALRMLDLADELDLVSTNTTEGKDVKGS